MFNVYTVVAMAICMVVFSGGNGGEGIRKGKREREENRKNKKEKGKEFKRVGITLNTTN